MHSYSIEWPKSVRRLPKTPLHPVIPQKTHFADFDSLRTLCVYFVIFAHSQLLLQTFTFLSDNQVWRIVSRLAYLSDVAVDVFFCISGFLISYLLFEEEASNGKISIGNFYVRRILRIWPLYFLILTTGFLLFPYIFGLFNQEYIVNNSLVYFLFFAGNYDILRISALRVSTDPIISPLWSISVEEQFYLVWPLLIAFSKNKKLICILAILGISVAFRLNFSQDWVTVYYSSFGSFFFLAAGSTLAYVAHYRSDILRRINRIPKIINIGIYVFSALAILITAPHYKSYFVPRDVLIAAFVCWVITEQIFHDKSFLKFGKIRFLDFWGKYTYGMYLWHSVCIYIIDRVFNNYGWWKTDSLAVVPYMLSILLCTHVISYVSYHAFEVSFLRLKHRFI